MNKDVKSFILLLLLPLFETCVSRNHKSEQKLINAIESNNPSVVLVLNPTKNTYCTGALIAPTLVVTAQHCIDHNAIGCGVTVSGKTPAKCFIDNQWKPGDYSSANAIHDFAVLTLGKDDLIIWPNWNKNQKLKLSIKSYPSELLNKPVELIGYGRTDWEGHMRDRKGISSGGQGVGIEAKNTNAPAQHRCTNIISSIELDQTMNSYGLIHFESETRNSGMCLPTFGDSGGPLLYHNPEDNLTYIVGIASNVYYPDTGKSDAAYVALISEFATRVVEDAMDWTLKDFERL